MRPSASVAAAAGVSLRRSMTWATNWRCRSSITDWKIARSSGVSGRKGLPMSLRSPDLIGAGRQSDLLHEPLGVEADHDHADGAGHGGRVRHDGVGGERHVVAAGGGDVHHAGDDRDAARRACNSCSSRKMMSEAVTVPPGLLMRTTTRAHLVVRRRLLRAPRARATSIGTRGGGEPIVRIAVRASRRRGSPRRPSGGSWRRPCPRPSPLPADGFGGSESIEMTEQPTSSTAASTSRSQRMAAVYAARASCGGSPARAYSAPMLDGCGVHEPHARRRAGRRPAAGRPRSIARRCIGCQSFDDACGHHGLLQVREPPACRRLQDPRRAEQAATLTPAERARGVIAFSSGNHAQGVALAARMVGTTAVVCMPKDAPALKLEATRSYGAEVVFYDRHHRRPRGSSPGG